MSFREEQQGRFYMGGNQENYKKLILPEQPLAKEFDKLKEEQDIKEARELLLELEKKKQEELDEKLERLELLPTDNKVIFLPYPRNPYKKILQGSLIVDFNGEFNNPDTGEKDKMQELVMCAKVIEVGPTCKYTQPGDDIYFVPGAAYPLPFMSLGYRVTTEPQILCILNENLKNRFKMI